MQQTVTVAPPPVVKRASSFSVWVHRIRGLLGVVFYLLTCLPLALLHFGCMLLYSWLRSETEDQRHERLCAWFFWWSAGYNWVLWLFLGLRWEFVLMSDDDREYVKRTPTFVTSNHFGFIDATLLSAGARRLEVQKLRGVAKESTKNYPVIGFLFRLGKVAFMRRRGNVDGRNLDVEDLEAFGRSVHQDRSWVVAFVEGTTFEQNPDEGFRNVRKPKTRGAEAILKNAPDHAFLIVTFVWHDYDVRKMLFESILPPGKRVTITTTLIRKPDAHSVREWLPAEWRALDARIDAMRRP